MKEKIEILLKTLNAAFDGASVEYTNADGRHKLDLKLPKVTHRVDFPAEVVAGNDAGHLKRLCKQVASHLQRNPDGRPKHLVVKGDGIHEEF